MTFINDGILEKSDNEIIIIKANKKTDYFIDENTKYKVANAPFFFEEIDYNFIIQVQIKPQFNKTYDAGAIVVFENDNKWVKAAFENTDLGYPSIVTVVTNSLSDDCNGEIIKNESIWIRVVRKNNYWSIHYSIDGKEWRMVRYFSLEFSKKIKVGISVQSPIGDGCKVEFKNYQIRENNFTNIRKGE